MHLLIEAASLRPATETRLGKRVVCTVQEAIKKEGAPLLLE